MAKAKAAGSGNLRQDPIKKVTSIGSDFTRSRPKNKQKRRNWKKYRGQGR